MEEGDKCGDDTGDEGEDKGDSNYVGDVFGGIYCLGPDDEGGCANNDHEDEDDGGVFDRLKGFDRLGGKGLLVVDIAEEFVGLI